MPKFTTTPPKYTYPPIDDFVNIMGEPFETRPDPEYLTVLFDRVLLKHFYPIGSTVWIKVSGTWVAGRIDRVDRIDPATHLTTQREAHNKNMDLKVYVAYNQDVLTKSWKEVIPMNPPFLHSSQQKICGNKTDLAMNFRALTKMIFSQDAPIDSDIEQKGEALKRYMTNFTRADHVHWFFDWCDMFLMIILWVSVNAGDPWNFHGILTNQALIGGNWKYIGVFVHNDIDTFMFNNLKEDLTKEDWEDIEPDTRVLELSEDYEDLLEKEMANAAEADEIVALSRGQL